ncbi:uncharacterized protein WM294_004348 [Sarcoramphus papa]
MCFLTRVGCLPLVVARSGKLGIFPEQVMSAQALLHLGKLQRCWEPNLQARISPAETRARQGIRSPRESLAVVQDGFKIEMAVLVLWWLLLLIQVSNTVLH